MMPDYTKNKNRFTTIGLVILNLFPVLGVFFNLWPWEDIIFFYWGECLLLGAATLFFRTKRLIVFVLVSLIAVIVMQLTAVFSDGAPCYAIVCPIYFMLVGELRIPLTFWSLYGVCWLGYIELVKSNYYLFIKRLHPMTRFTGYLVFMGIAIITCFILTATIYDEWEIAANLPLSVYLIFLSYAVAIPTISIGMLRVIDMIGSRHFLQFLFGTYHAPRQQDRIVLFLDMVGSSTMAEKLTPKDSMLLIASFIFDTSDAIQRNAGDVLNYTGDGLVATWKRKHANRALFAIEAMQARIKANSHIYKEQFGMVPEFRIGVHAGEVVIAQIGAEKLFLGLHGDVVNIASRLEQMNKELGTTVLLSDTVIQGISAPYQEKLKLVGKKSIRGRKEKIEVWTLRTTPSI